MRSKTVLSVFVVLLLMAMGATAKADTFTSTSAGVDFAVNDNGPFYVSNLQQFTPLASSFLNPGYFVVTTQPAPYSDAGIVLYFNGGLTLGQLEGVNVTSLGAPLDINLWLDTGGDGQFFAFNGSGLMTGTANDSYGSHAGQSIDGSSQFYMQGGDGAGSTYTLAALQAGLDPGISGSTPVALWIGMTNPPAGTDANVAAISEVDVNTTPEPGSLVLMGTGILGLAGAMRRRLA